jgi:hypothetical protein
MKRASRWLAATAALLWLSSGNAAEPAGAVKAVTGSAERSRTPVTQVRSDAQVPTASSSDVGLTVVRARSNAQIPAASSDDVKVVVDQARAEAPVADPEYKAVDLADRRVTNYELNPRRRLPEARAAEIEAWANVNRRGDYNAAHIHEPKYIWSGVYYVDPGDAEPASGCIKFEDRSGVAKEIVHNPDPFEREVAVKPEAGLMLMFPVTLFHYVEPYLGQSPRISIAFNLANAGFTIPVYDYVRPTWWSEPPRIVHEFRRLKARLGLRKPMR